MNMSLRRQLTLCFTALIGALFLINYFVTSFFLESYYYMRKQQVLVDAYNMLNENITDEGGLEEEPMTRTDDGLRNERYFAGCCGS